MRKVSFALSVSMLLVAVLPPVAAGDIQMPSGDDLAAVANSNRDLGQADPRNTSALSTDGLVAWYPFENGLEDATGNGNDGVVQPSSGSIDYHPGQVGSAAVFNHNSDHFMRVLSAQLDFLDRGDQDWTITLWLKQTELASGGIWDKHKAYGSGFESLFNNAESLSYWWEDDGTPGGDQGGVDVPVPSNRWLAVAYVLRAGTLELYIDGQLEDSTPTNPAADWDDPLPHFDLGASRGRAFSGLLDEVRIWNRALSENEISTLAQKATTCVDSIAPTRRQFGAGGGSASFSIEAPDDCAWSVQTDEPWIELLGDAAGQGAVAVTYLVQPNPLVRGRVGYLRVAGKEQMVWQSGTGIVADTASLGGIVRRRDTGQPLGGAQVSLGALQTSSETGTGRYAFDAVPAGDYQLAASLAGYESLTVPVTLAPLSSAARDLALQPEGTAVVPAVYALSSRYDKQVFFLEGAAHAVDFTAHVDWAGQTPSRVRWLDDQGTLAETSTTTTTATESIDIGASLSACEQLRAQAVTSAGATSAPAAANLAVMSNPFHPVSMIRRDNGDSHVYQPGFSVEDWDFFAGGSLSPAIGVPDGVPLFGGKEIKIEFKPALKAELASDGTGYVRLNRPSLLELEEKWGCKDNAKKIMALLKDAIKKGKVDRRRLPKQYIAGLDFELFPYLRIDNRFDADACRWDYLDGSHLGLVSALTLKKTQQMVTPVGPVPVPWYVKASLTLGTQAELAVLGLDGDGDWELASDLTGEVSAKAAIGAGVDAVAAVEGWLSGGFRQGFRFQRDVSPLVAEVTLGGGVSVYALIFSYDLFDLEWSCDLLTGDCTGPGLGGAAALAEQAAAPRLIAREYLLAPNAGAFPGGVDVQRQARPPAIDSDALDEGPLVETAIAAVQEAVFPLSQSALSAAGDVLHAAWLFDDPARSAVNRTVAVFSRWQGDAFAPFAPIADDGTADFHPRLLAFADGAGAAVWEDVATALADDATPEQMAAALEISAAHYNPLTASWQHTRLTDNDALDRSPRLAGSADDLWVVWIANAADDLRGSATAPNLLRARHWDGVDWGPAQTLASVPHGIVNLELAYDGVDGVLVLSVDTDGDGETVADHELFAVHLTGAVWGALEQLTDDDIADDSPHLTPAAHGPRRLVWLRGDALVEAPVADPADQTVIYADAYSTNLAAFSTGRGR